MFHANPRLKADSFLPDEHAVSSDNRRRGSRRLFRLGRLLAIWAAALALPLLHSAVVPGAEEADEKEEIQPPEEVVLETSDGVQLSATFWPGSKGKESVPVILLHDMKGSSNDFGKLPGDLQKLGHAVLVPDLRGHGRSKERLGGKKPLDAAAGMPRTEFLGMVRFDMEELKQFLMKKNDAKELNIEKLCVVGAGMGASVALNWCRLDWSWPPLATGKQGQDVKGLILISPEWSTFGLPLKTALAPPQASYTILDPKLRRLLKNPDQLDFQREVAVLIVAGKGKSRAVRDAKQLFTKFERARKDARTEESETPKPKDLFYGNLNTTLQGTKMLGVKGLNLELYIAQFIKRCLVDRPYPWTSRKKN